MIKKLSVFLFVVIILTLTGCSNKEDISSDISSIESSTAVDFTTDNESSFETSAELTPSSEKQETVVSTTESKEIKPEVKEEKPIANSSVSTAEQKTSDIQSGVSSTPQIQNATAADSKEIALLIAKAINEYRNKNNVDNAIVLPGLTEYAEYRSRQLISNFSHDTFDERKAATELKYGRYIEPSLYGMAGDPYYTASSGEAIVKAGYAGSKEYVAESIATLVFNSVAHWSYVGNPINKYIAVGVTYESGLWYCDIAVSDVNYDNERN